MTINFNCIKNYLLEYKKNFYNKIWSNFNLIIFLFYDYVYVYLIYL